MRPLENLKSAALDLNFEGGDGTPLRALLGGEIDFASAPAMQARILATLEQHATNALIMDLSRVQFLDSSGLRVIVQVQRELGDAGGSLVLFDPAPPVMRILELTGLDRHLQIAATLPEAERMLAAGGTQE